MDAALAGLIGAGIGALAGLAGSLISARAQDRRERENFLRQRKADAYGQAVAHLFRAAARRSHLTSEGGPILSKEDQAAWFLDIADALNSLTAVIAFVGSGFRNELIEVLQHFGSAAFELTQKGLGVASTKRPLVEFPGSSAIQAMAG